MDWLQLSLGFSALPSQSRTSSVLQLIKKLSNYDWRFFFLKDLSRGQGNSQVTGGSNAYSLSLQCQLRKSQSRPVSHKKQGTSVMREWRCGVTLAKLSVLRRKSVLSLAWQVHAVGMAAY